MEIQQVWEIKLRSSALNIVYVRCLWKYEKCRQYNISVKKMKLWIDLKIWIWVISPKVVLKTMEMHELPKETAQPKKIITRLRWSLNNANMRSLWTNSHFYLTSPEEFISVSNGKYNQPDKKIKSPYRRTNHKPFDCMSHNCRPDKFTVLYAW